MIIPIYTSSHKLYFEKTLLKENQICSYEPIRTHSYDRSFFHEVEGCDSPKVCVEVPDDWKWTDFHGIHNLEVPYETPVVIANIQRWHIPPAYLLDLVRAKQFGCRVVSCEALPVVSMPETQEMMFEGEVA